MNPKFHIKIRVAINKLKKLREKQFKTSFLRGKSLSAIEYKEMRKQEILADLFYKYPNIKRDVEERLLNRDADNFYKMVFVEIIDILDEIRKEYMKKAIMEREFREPLYLPERRTHSIWMDGAAKSRVEPISVSFPKKVLSVVRNLIKKIDRLDHQVTLKECTRRGIPLDSPNEVLNTVKSMRMSPIIKMAFIRYPILKNYVIPYLIPLEISIKDFPGKMKQPDVLTIFRAIERELVVEQRVLKELPKRKKAKQDLNKIVTKVFEEENEKRKRETIEDYECIEPDGRVLDAE